MKQIKIYKIYNPKTEQFSKGGTWPTWSKTGKTWNNLGSLKCHLLQLSKQQITKHYEGCEIVEFVSETTLIDTKRTPVEEFGVNLIDEKLKKEEIEQANYRALRAAREIEEARATLAKHGADT